MTLFCLSTWAASVVADRPEADREDVGPTAPASRSPFAYANVDPLDDDLVKPPDVRPTCEADLAAASIAYQPDKLTPLVQPDTKIVCGAPQVVAYRESPAKIAWSPSVLTTCTMALAIARFETIVQEEAVRAFDRRVAHIHHLGTFDCRPMLAFPGWVSEHSYANAIDVAEFVLEDGTSIKIYDHFAPKQPVATTREAAFLRKVARRAYDEEVFSSVLTPFFDRHHVDHFHLDLARTRSDGAAFVKPR
ncbi:MAG: extensin family protein [Myxococcales bacterium]|nr:extensin family protein [Myxococcales bacterium]